MVKKVNPVPKGYRTVTPSLVVTDVTLAIDFYARAFDAQLLTQSNDASDSYAVQATIKIGNSIVILQQEALELGILSPITLGSNASHQHLYVEAVDDVWARALEAGASAISAPVDMYWGDRTAVLIDVFGHRWSLASRVEHVLKVEVQKRLEAINGQKTADELPEPLSETQDLEEMPAEFVEFASDSSLYAATDLPGYAPEVTA